MEVSTIMQTIMRWIHKNGKSAPDKRFKNVNFLEEIKKGNMAASLFYSVVLMFVAVIVTIAIN